MLAALQHQLIAIAVGPAVSRLVHGGPAGTRCHEAGHAVAHWRFGFPIEYVTVEGQPHLQSVSRREIGESSPRTSARPSLSDHELMLVGIDDGDADGTTREYQRIEALADQFVHENWPLIAALAREFLTRPTMTGAEVTAFLRAEQEWHERRRGLN